MTAQESMREPAQELVQNHRAPVTLEAVASHARVSRQTISNALNAPHRLAPDTLKRALSSIDTLGYRPNQAARSLRTSTSQLIGFRIEPSRDGINGAVLDRFLHALCEATRSHGYNVLLFTADNDGQEIERFDDLVLRRAVDAFVLSSTHQGDSRTAWLADRSLPFVTFGRPWGQTHVAHSWVDIDGAAGTQAAVEHLVELGHRRVGFIGWPLGSGVGDDRQLGWSRAVHTHDLATGGLDLHGEDGVDTGSALADRLLAQPHPPTGIVCASDSLALGAIHAVVDRGLHPGRDVAVVGFDDTPVAMGSLPGISSVRQPVEDAAALIARLLATHLTGAEVPAVGELIAPQLVVRASSFPTAHP